MTDRESIAAYIEARAEQIRDRADKGATGPGREHAVHLDALASDIRSGLDLPQLAVAA